MNRPPTSRGSEPWPALPYEAWRETCATLHMWLQIVGKIRVALAPWVNHQWHVTLYLTSRGLTTSPMPYGSGTFQVDFDFIDHAVRISRSDGREGRVALRPRTVADFYHALMQELRRLDIAVQINGSPNEVNDPIPFAEDEIHGAYDGEYAQRFWRVLSSSARAFEDFRADFIGKCSPVHLFWGGPDLAVTRFSGRPAPKHPGRVAHLPDWVSREAYSHEVSSAGFWPGGDAYPRPIFYSYAYPTPEGFSSARIQPAAAGWDEDLSEFVLPYDAVRASAWPEEEIARFLASTYEVAAELGGWDRPALEWGPEGRPPVGGRSNEE